VVDCPPESLPGKLLVDIGGTTACPLEVLRWIVDDGGKRVVVDNPLPLLVLLFVPPTTPPTIAPITIMAAISMNILHFFRRYHGTEYDEM